MTMNSYDELKGRIRGPVFSIITPFHEDESIDYPALKNYIELINAAGGDIFFVMAYNSRFSQLSWDEIKALNKFVVKTAKELDQNNIVIVADPIHCSTNVSCEFANHAKEIGADLISLIFREKHYSDNQVFKHFKTVSDSCEIGILVHEMPFLSGYGERFTGYSLELLSELADIPNIIAIKEDAKDDTFSRQVINTIKDRVSIIISGGGKQQFLRFADIGCQAWLNGIGVFEPKLASKFWREYQIGNMGVCMEIINKIETPFFERAVKKYGWHLTIKAVLEHQGLMKRCERMPLMQLSDDDARFVGDVIDSLPIQKILN